MTRSTPAERRRVKHVGQGIKVGADQLIPRGQLIRVGRKVDHRVDAMEMRDPIFVEHGKIGHDDVGIIVGSVFIDQDQVVNVGPGHAELAADVAAAPVIRTVRGSSSMSPGSSSS